MGRKILILAGAVALAAEALGTLIVAAGFYGFVAFGNGVKFGPAGPGLLKIVVDRAEPGPVRARCCSARSSWPWRRSAWC